MLDIAWGYDLGDDHAHVTTNVSPGLPGQSVDVFSTEDVVRVLAEGGTVVYEHGQAPLR